MTDQEGKPTFGRHAPARGRWMLALLPLVLAGCATLGNRGESLVPTRYQLRTGPFVVSSNVPFPADSPTVRCLRDLERDLAKSLDYRPLPEEEPVEIYVLNDREAFAHFLRFYYPELPPRRAFFISQGSRRVVYTFHNERLDEDLRHEATHALLRGFYGDLPLWLDEGLAEYFEIGSDVIDVQCEHLEKLPKDLEKGWMPDMTRLESLTDIREMSPRDYRESWAWVHLLLSDAYKGRPILLDYLRQCKGSSHPLALSQKLSESGTTARQLVAHIEAVESRVVARKPDSPKSDPIYRLQSRGIDAPVLPAPPAPRGGFFRRILSSILGG